MANGRGFFRRNKALTVVASGEQINLKSNHAVKAVLRNRQTWQSQAWDVFDAVGEVKYGVGYLASLISRVVLYAAELPDETDNEPVRTTNPVPQDVLERLGSHVDRAELQADLAINLLVPGEAFLVSIAARDVTVNSLGEVLTDATEERWLIRSIDEVVISGGIVKVEDHMTGEFIVLDQDAGDVFIRIWRQHPRKHYLPDSHVRGILGAAEELLWWDSAAIASAKNRLVSSGIMEIPSNMEVPATTDDEALLTGAQRTAKVLFETAKLTLTNPGDSASSIPIFVTYPENDQRKSGLNFNVIDRPQDAFLEVRTDRCLLRVAQGLNVPLEVIRGLSQATHWGGGQIEEATFREHVEPLVVQICAALTQSYLLPSLREMGVANPEDYVIWYDASNLVVHQDMSQAADRGVELGLVSGAAWRRIRGIPERDAPTPEERAEILEWLKESKGSSPQNQGIIPNPQKPSSPTDPTTPPTENPPGKRTPVPQSAAPLRGKGQKQLAVIGQLQVLGDMAIRRALEKAGNKLRTRSKSTAYEATLRGIAPDQVAFTLGREACLKIGVDDVFNGSFDDISKRFYTIVESSELSNLYTGHLAAAKTFTDILRQTASVFLYTGVDDSGFLVDPGMVGEVLGQLVPK